MYNWSTDEQVFKDNKRKETIWRLEQMVNFGLGGSKIRTQDLKKYWKEMNIDPARRKFFSLLLYGK